MEEYNQSTSHESKEVSGLAVSPRIPPIWRDRLRLWFVQFEAIVSAQKKGDKAMYELVLGQLERQDIEEISDIMLNPPAEHKYETIKKRLLDVYEESEQRQLQRLLSELELGEMKPSQLLRRMQHLARDKLSESALRLMWMNHLPPAARAVLAVSENIAKHSQLSELALMADTVVEHSTPAAPANSVFAVATQVRPPTPQTLPLAQAHSLSELYAKLDLLTHEIAEVKANQNRERPFYQNRRYRSRSRSRGQQQNSGSATTCYYHRTFGTEARKCTQPCNFRKQQEN